MLVAKTLNPTGRDSKNSGLFRQIYYPEHLLYTSTEHNGMKKKQVNIRLYHINIYLAFIFNSPINSQRKQLKSRKVCIIRVVVRNSFGINKCMQSADSLQYFREHRKKVSDWNKNFRWRIFIYWSSLAVTRAYKPAK